MTTISGNVHNPTTGRHETEGAVELLDPINSRQCLFSAAINEHGAYSMQGVDGGSYVLFCSVWAAGKQYHWEIPLTLKDAENHVHIDLLANTAQTLDQI